MRRSLLLMLVCLGIAGCSQTVKTEPGPGRLSPGQTVFVDDGTCPSGQVKKVTGGNRSQGVGRARECVEAPKN